MELDISLAKLLLSVGSIVFSGALAWGIAKTQLKNYGERLDKLEKAKESQWNRIDSIKQQLNLTSDTTERISMLVQPENLKEFWIEDTKFRTSMELRLSTLEQQAERDHDDMRLIGTILADHLNGSTAPDPETRHRDSSRKKR